MQHNREHKWTTLKVALIVVSLPNIVLS